MSKDIENITKTNTYGVNVGTWGTTHGGKSGYWNEIKALLGFGELSTQHARVTITMPNNPQSRELVEKYCKNPPIPYETRTRVVKKAIQKGGKWVAGDEIAFQEEAIVINFSWYKGGSDQEVPYTLMGYSGDSYIKAKQFERSLKNFKWAGWKKGFIYKAQTSKTLEPKIHHLDRIIDQVFQKIKDTLEKAKHNENLDKIEKIQLQTTIDKLKTLVSENPILPHDTPEQVTKKIIDLENRLNQHLIQTLGHKLYTTFQFAKTPIHDFLKKHAKHTSVEDEMMLIGSGLAPTHEVRFPINLERLNSTKAEHRTHQTSESSGLDVEPMLKMMHQIAKEGVENKKGWTVSRNCSETARRILYAGTTQDDKSLKKIFRERSTITSPQKLLNWALRYQEYISHKIQEKLVKPVYELFKNRKRGKAIVESIPKPQNAAKKKPDATTLKFHEAAKAPVQTPDLKKAFVEELKSKLKMRDK